MTDPKGQAAPEQGTTVDHEEEHGESDASRIPGWLAEHKYLFLTVEALLLVLLAIAGASHGPVETFLLEAAALSVQVVAWQWGYQRRKVISWQDATTAVYVDCEMAAVDEMEGSAFEAYIVKLMTALGYGKARTTGNNHYNKPVDIVAESPDMASEVGVECKRQQGKVDSEVITKLVGAVNMHPYKGHIPILITNSSLTTVADVRARKDKVTVYQRDGLRKLIAEARPTMERDGVSALDFLADGISVPRPPPPPGHVTETARRMRTAALCFSGVMAIVLLVQIATKPHTVSARSASRATLSPAPPQTRAKAITNAAVAQPTPCAVALAYLAAISKHDWPEVWKLGGKNVGRGPYASYAGMVRGYQGTVKDVPVTLKTAGQTVSGQFLAYESDGEIRTYAFTYMIRDGVIVRATAYEVKSTRQT